jgi:tetratricopeptide (TPR) repeat protein
MNIRMAALAATFMLGAATGAMAQGSQPAPAAQAPLPQLPQPQRAYDLTRAERAALIPAIQAVERSDWAAAQAALPAAQAAARGPDAKYAVAQVQLRIGIETNNTALQSEALDGIIASGGASPAEMPALYENQASLAMAAGNSAKANQALTRLAALNPNDPDILVRIARLRGGADAPGAIQLYRQAIGLKQAAGQPVPAEWRQQIAGIAYRARMPETLDYMRELLAASPSVPAWHDTLAIYGDLRSPDSALKLDIYRLMRAAGAMTSERDFTEYGEAALEARAVGEVKAVLEEGLARNLITVNAGYARERLATANQRAAEDRASLAAERRTVLAGGDGRAALRLGDAYYGYGQYAEAAELYRAALQKGGQDANLVNTRLGAALARASQRSEAEAAFRAVTGPRAELAQLWLLWLSTRQP